MSFISKIQLKIVYLKKANNIKIYYLNDKAKKILKL